MTKEQIRAALGVLEAIRDAIREAGETGIPSGHLYAMLMGMGMSFESYTKAIQLLKDADQITEQYHVLRAK